MLAPVIFFNFKTAINLKCETNVNASLSCEIRLRVSIFTHAYVSEENGVRWNEWGGGMKGKEKGQSWCTPPFEGKREAAESEKAPHVGSRLFQYRVFGQLF